MSLFIQSANALVSRVAQWVGVIPRSTAITATAYNSSTGVLTVSTNPTSTILECFSNLGIEKSLDDLLTIGKEIQIARIQTKLKFGINYRDIFENLSPRFFQMPTAHGITPKNIFYDTYFPIFQNLITSRYSIKI